VRVDDDGHLLAVPRRHDEEQDGPPPRIEIVPQGTRGGVAPAVGDRVLASLKRRGKTTYEARIIRLLGSAPRKVLGLYEEPDGRNGIGLVNPTDRKLKVSFDIRPADKNGALPGDIVWVEPAGGALARRARVIERVGPMSDPRTVSLISIAANDIPVEFPEAALKEAESSKAAPLGDRLDLRRVPLVTIDGEDARVCLGTADHHRVQHPGPADVADECRRAAQELRILEPFDARPGVRHPDSFPQRCRRSASVPLIRPSRDRSLVCSRRRP